LENHRFFKEKSEKPKKSIFSVRNQKSHLFKYLVSAENVAVFPLF